MTPRFSPQIRVRRKNARRRFLKTKDAVITWYREEILSKQPKPLMAVWSRSILRREAPFLGAFPRQRINSKKNAFVVGLGHTQHESSLGVVLTQSPVSDQKEWWRIGEVKLQFEKDRVCIVAVQGGPKGSIKYLKDFEKTVGMPWPNFLIKRIEAVARRLGYAKLEFPDVENESFDGLRDGFASWVTYGEGLEIAARMKRFYSKIRKALGFTKKDEPDPFPDYPSPWVKKL